MIAQALLGEATAQVIVAGELTLGVAAVKIDEIVASVRDLNCVVIDGKVIFDGVLHKQIFFVDTEGIVRHQAEDVRFSGFIDFPGAVAGTPCQVETVVEFLNFQLLSPLILRQTAVLAVTVRLFDPPPGQIFMNTAPAGADVFFGGGSAPGAVFRTSGRRQSSGRRFTVQARPA